jgi:hypothetical protein
MAHGVRGSSRAEAIEGGRRETELERADRQLGELLQELRVVQTGVQVLFAFLLGVPFAARFSELDATQRAIYFATLMLAGLAILLLLAPTAWHRALFRQGDKPHLVGVSHRLAMAGLACVGLDVIAVVALIASVLYPGAVTWLAPLALAIVAVALWVALPLLRRARAHGAPPTGP